MDVLEQMSFGQIMDFYFKDSGQQQIEKLAYSIRRWKGLPKDPEMDAQINLIYETRYSCFKHILTVVLQHDEAQHFWQFETFSKLLGTHPKYAFARLVNFRRSLWMDLDYFPGRSLSTLDLYSWIQMLQQQL